MYEMKQSYFQPQGPYNPSYYPPQSPNFQDQYSTIPARVANENYLPRQASFSLQNSNVLRNESNKWNIHSGNQGNINGFPFGQERLQIFNEVQKKMETSIDQENKKVLEKFRIDAIKNRNQRVMKHLGKIPYVTQSMLPGSSLDASKFIERQPAPPPKVTLKPIHHQPPIQQPQYVYVPIVYPQQKQQTFPIVKTPRKVAHSSASIGVEVNFEQEFPLKSKKKHKKRYYTIEEQEEEQAMSKIEDMLHEINVKLKRNTDLISKSTIEDESLAVSRMIPEKQTVFHYSPVRNFEALHEEDSKLPSIKYSGKSISLKERSKTLSSQNSIKDHLKLIKKNRRRLQDLDSYVYL